MVTGWLKLDVRSIVLGMWTNIVTCSVVTVFVSTRYCTESTYFSIRSLSENSVQIYREGSSGAYWGYFFSLIISWRNSHIFSDILEYYLVISIRFNCAGWSDFRNYHSNTSDYERSGRIIGYITPELSIEFHYLVMSDKRLNWRNN